MVVFFKRIGILMGNDQKTGYRFFTDMGAFLAQ
jgi:hypothetical protein